MLDAEGIDISRPDSTYGRPPLHAAALSGSESGLEMLLVAPGIDANHVDYDGANVPIGVTRTLAQGYTGYTLYVLYGRRERTTC